MSVTSNSKYSRIDTVSKTDADKSKSSLNAALILDVSKSLSPRSSPIPPNPHNNKQTINTSQRSDSSTQDQETELHANVNDESSLLTTNTNNTENGISINNAPDSDSESDSESDSDSDQNGTIIITQSHQDEQDGEEYDEDIEDEDKTEDESDTDSDELTPLPMNTRSSNRTSSTQKHKGSIYNFQANEQILKQELVQDMLERLKIALTFLLHDNSPLWNEHDEFEMKEDNNNNLVSSIYAKGTLSTGNMIHHNDIYKKKKSIKRQWSGRSINSIKSNTSSNANRTNRANLNFQKRCTEYTESIAMYGSFKRNHQKLNSLYDDKYIIEWSRIYKLWCQWLEYVDLLQQGQSIDHIDLHDELVQNQRVLEVNK